MKSLVRFFSTLSLVIISLVNISAQESWSLEQCIGYAIENNIQVKQQELNINMNQANLKQSKLDLLPSLNGSAYQSFTYGRAVNDQNSVSEDIASTSLGLNSSVNIFDGFLKYNTYKQNKFDLKASISDVEKIKNNIALSIASSYLQILFSEELVSTARKQVELTKLQLERTKVLVNAGSLPEGNLLDIEAQLASDELQLINSENQLTLAYLNLTQLLELKNPQGFSIQKPVLPIIEETIILESTSDIFETAVNTMPQIAGANYRLTSANQGIKIAKANLYPTLTLSANYGSRAQKFLKEYYYDPIPYDNIDQYVLYTEDSYMDQFKDKASFSFGFNLSIPIFNGGRVKNGITNARINLDRSRLNLETEKNSLFKEIQQASADAAAALKKYHATSKSLSALQESYRYTEQKFGLGMVTTLDYTTAKTRLAKSETDLLQAKYEFIFKTKILDFYKGNPIKL